MIVGAGLAANLGVAVGDPIVLLANTATGGVHAVEGYVRGTFYTATKAFDDAALRLHIDLARELLRTDGSHSWVVVLDKTSNTDGVAAELTSRLAREGLDIVIWSELADFYNKTVVLFSRQVDVVQLIIGLIIVLSISNTMLMNVMERTGEIGTMMAIGLRRHKILGQFLNESFLLGIAGGALGVAVGYIAALVISVIGIPMPPGPAMAVGFTGEVLVTPGLAATGLALAIISTVLAGLYPAWKASRLEIVDALRYNR